MEAVCSSGRKYDSPKKIQVTNKDLGCCTFQTISLTKPFNLFLETTRYLAEYPTSWAVAGLTYLRIFNMLGSGRHRTTQDIQCLW
jgi:hypothetical protein